MSEFLETRDVSTGLDVKIKEEIVDYDDPHDDGGTFDEPLELTVNKPIHTVETECNDEFENGIQIKKEVLDDELQSDFEAPLQTGSEDQFSNENQLYPVGQVRHAIPEMEGNYSNEYILGDSLPTVVPSSSFISVVNYTGKKLCNYPRKDFKRRKLMVESSEENKTLEKPPPAKRKRPPKDPNKAVIPRAKVSQPQNGPKRSKYSKTVQPIDSILLEDQSIAFPCDLCTHTSKTRSDLKSHKLIHKVEAPHVCEECGYAYKKYTDLKNHLYAHEEIKRYRCEHCAYSSDFMSRLTTHKIIHSGEKPYACPQCPYTCSRPSNLKRHSLKHSEVRIYCCDQCPYRSKDLTGLTVHKLVHVDTKPHVCEVCNSSYVNLKSLTHHRKKHEHGNPVNIVIPNPIV